jgi:hypothetical protein
MMCDEHKKDVIGNCQLCGKSMCRQCVAKTVGKKMFCRKCSNEVGYIIEKKQIEIAKNLESNEEKRKRVTRLIEKY